MSGSAHSAVKHELLVRYLDAWTPAALHRAKQAVYLSWAGLDAARTALPVFAEFADLPRARTITMLVPPSVDIGELAPVPGVVVSVVDSPRPAGLAWFDNGDDAEIVGREVLVASSSPVDCRQWTFHCRVELVSAAGEAQWLTFGCASEKSLERFKDELWALDEFAGIQLRDPADDEGALSDISAVAHLGPLRRCLLRHLTEATDGQTLADLRAWTLHDTMFRAGDATRAVQAMLSAGSVTREPANGRLSNDTLIRLR
jgi:hypothetical protein